MAKTLNGMTTLNYEYIPVLFSRSPNDHAVYNQAANQNSVWYNMPHLYKRCDVMVRYST